MHLATKEVRGVRGDHAGLYFYGEIHEVSPLTLKFVFRTNSAEMAAAAKIQVVFVWDLNPCR